MNFKELDNLGLAKPYQFMHGDQEYAIYVEYDQVDRENLRACLAVPTPSDGGYVALNVLTHSARPLPVEKIGGAKEFMKTVFIPKVNAYLKENGGGDNTFPIDDEFYKQFNWIMENSLAYVNGEIVTSL